MPKTNNTFSPTPKFVYTMVDTFGKKSFIFRMKFVAHERFQYVLLKKFGENIDALLIVQIVLERFAIVVGLYFCRG